MTPIEQSIPPFLIECSHITKTYASLAALDDVTLSIRPGAVHALVGEAGAGKTTLMKILGGFIRTGDYSGEVLLEGESLALHSPSDALKHGIAIVPRKFTVLENASVADNITLASWQLRKSFWVSRGAEAERSRQLLEEWSIDVDIDASVASLAPLQKRLLMIARALAIDPKLVVLDEPLADVPGFHASAQLLRFVRRLGERGMTCLYLTQRPEDAMTVASTITALRDGRVVGSWEGPAYDKEAIVAALPGSRANLPNAPKDDFSESKGPFGALNEYFDRLMRPNG